MSNTLFIGKVLLTFDELPSTNDYARSWIAGTSTKSAAKNRPPEGTVVLAASQSAGRGQFGSKWLANPGENLTFSVIFYPNWLALQSQFSLSEAVALSVRDTVVHYLQPGPSVGIKWPNDIYADNKKLAGILIENTVLGGQYEAAIVGIGLNVNQIQFSSDLPHAGSMATVSGSTFDVELVLGTLLQNLERRYLQLRAGHFSSVHADYQSHLYRNGQVSEFELPDGSSLRGVITGTDPTGLLQIQTDAGIQSFEVKGIRMLI